MPTNQYCLQRVETRLEIVCSKWYTRKMSSQENIQQRRSPEIGYTASRKYIRLHEDGEGELNMNMLDVVNPIYQFSNRCERVRNGKGFRPNTYKAGMRTTERISTVEYQKIPGIQELRSPIAVLDTRT
jgi:hypothetical protein